MAVWSEVDIRTALAAGRFDGDYFKPGDLKAIALMQDQGASKLEDICTILNGTTPGGYDESGTLAVVRSGDLVAPLIYPTCGRTFLRTFPAKEHVRVMDGDVLISSIGLGSIGKISLVVDASDLITVSEVTILRDPTIAPEFLFSYLASPAGQAQIDREVTGATGQQHLLKSKVGAILVPTPPAGVESQLRELIKAAYSQQEAARLSYAHAEALLESSLGLDEL